jgi:N-methylhydantoinase A
MVRALRAQFAQRGLDPAAHAIVSMGGCGGLFNALIAQELGIQRVLIPELTSVLSAFGAANADIRRERSVSMNLCMPCDAQQVEVKMSELAFNIHADLAADGIAECDRSLMFEADLRFMRQQSELNVACVDGFSPLQQERIIEDFKAEYGRRYGQGALISGTPVELVALRAIGYGRTVRAGLAADLRDGESRPPSVVSNRTVYVGKHGSDLHVPVFDGADLLPGQALTGPVLIDSRDTTIWIPANVRATVDKHRTITLEIPR